MRATDPPDGCAWAVEVAHPDLGRYWLYGRHRGELLFTENETNVERLWGRPNAAPFANDAFHRRVIEGADEAVNPALTGSKCAIWTKLLLASGARAQIELALSARPMASPFERSDAAFTDRQREADEFYRELLPDVDSDDRNVARQAFAGMIWSKQFFHYDVDRWLKGDRHPPPETRLQGRNATWKHLKAADVISMPDAWEYPWFAAWDLGLHCCVLALIDVDFAKDQIELMLNERYLNPNGQIPAYEWNFTDVNPPVHGAQGFPRRAGAARERRHCLLAARFHQAASQLRLVDQPQGRGRGQYFRGRFSRPRQHLGVRPLPASAARLPAQAGRRHRLDGDVCAQHDCYCARAHANRSRLRRHRDPGL
jgi:hypothetical protein